MLLAVCMLVCATIGNAGIVASDEKLNTVSATENILEPKQEKSQNSQIFSENFGFGFHFGIGANDPKSMEEINNAVPAAHLDKNNQILGMEVLFEGELDKPENKLGIKFAFDWYGENELTVPNVIYSATEETKAFSASLYYKRDGGVAHWSAYGGLGVSFFHTKVVSRGVGILNYHETAQTPSMHIIGGVEYRFDAPCAIGLEAKYNFHAKIRDKAADLVLSDRSGLSGAITARLYF